MVESFSQQNGVKKPEVGTKTLVPRKKKTPFFMKWSKMPSIMGLSMILIFYGGKNEMKSLLFRLAKGGRSFFNDNVKKGHLFKYSVKDFNHIIIDSQNLLNIFNKRYAVVKTGRYPLNQLASASAAAQQEEEKKGMERGATATGTSNSQRTS